MKTYKTTISAILSRAEQFERIKVQIGFPTDNGLREFVFGEVDSPERQLPDRDQRVPIVVRESSDGQQLTILCDGSEPRWYE